MICQYCGEKLVVVRWRCVAQEQDGQPCRDRRGKIQYYHSGYQHKDGWPCPKEDA